MPATSWTEQTLVDSGFTEQTKSADSWTEGTSTSASWVHGSRGLRVDGFALFGIPIPVEEGVQYDEAQAVWTESSLA